jgi:hypothetical protein
MKVLDVENDQAQGIIHARLGRSAQDVLEAAVVLEAWGGIAATDALRLGADALPSETAAPPVGLQAPAEREGRDSVLAEGIALLMGILSVAAWATPLSVQLGFSTLRHGLLVALPVTLAVQWMIRTRYLSRRHGLRMLAVDSVPLLAIMLLAIVPLLLVPGYGLLAATFVTIFVGGTVLARRGWALGYGALLTAEAAGLGCGLPARASLAVLTGVTVAAAMVAVRTASTGTDELPGRLGRVLTAGVLGACLGVLLVGDPTLGWGIHGAFPALALLPSVIGGAWGGYHLWQFSDEVPRGLRGVSLSDASQPASDGPAMNVVVGAIARLLAATVSLSVLVLVLGHVTSGNDSISLFLAFGCVSVLTMFVSLFESLGYSRWAVLAAVTGVTAELVVTRCVGSSVAGAGLMAGGVAGTAVAFTPMLGILRRPGRILATALWIH